MVAVGNDMERITYGENPFLVAAYVRDLRVERDPVERFEHVKWTRPPGRQTDYENGGLKMVGSSMPRSLKRILQSPEHYETRNQ